MQKNSKLVYPSILNDCAQDDRVVFTSSNIPLIKDIIRSSNVVRDQIIILKLPFTIIQNADLLTKFAHAVQLLDLCGVKVFIIHEHIDLRTGSFEALGLNTEIVQAINDGTNSQLMEMIVSGYINKNIVSKLCSLGCDAIGISCKDTNLIQAKKSKLSHISKSAENRSIIDIGFINEPVVVNPDILLNFKNNNIVSVISPIANDAEGNTQLLDVNLTALAIASALVVDHLIFFCAESILPDGALKVRDVNVLKSMLDENNIKKDLLKVAIAAMDDNVDNVHFISAASPDSILLSMFSDNNIMF